MTKLNEARHILNSIDALAAKTAPAKSEVEAFHSAFEAAMAKRHEDDAPTDEPDDQECRDCGDPTGDPDEAQCEDCMEADEIENEARVAKVRLNAELDTKITKVLRLLQELGADECDAEENGFSVVERNLDNAQEIARKLNATLVLAKSNLQNL